MKFDKIFVLNSEYECREVYAWVGEKGLLAVYPSSERGNSWTVTHLKSGGSVYTFYTELRAKAAMGRLELLGGWENGNVDSFKTNKKLAKQVYEIIRDAER